jgi:hypothetical protein
MRQPQGRKQDERIHLRDAELDMLTLGGKIPIESGWDAFALEGAGYRLAREQSPTVHPRAKVGGYRDVWRCGDDPLDKWRLLARQSLSSAPKPDCVDIVGSMVTDSSSSGPRP